MKAREKYKLIMEPLREVFPQMNTIVRGNELWYVNRRCKFLLYISPSLSSAGYFLGIHAALGSFYQGFRADPDGYPVIKSPLFYDAVHCVQDIVNLNSYDDVDRYCIQQAKDILLWINANIVQYVLKTEDYSSYITANERIRSLRHVRSVSAADAWDYLGVFDRNRALNYIEEQLAKSTIGRTYMPEYKECERLKVLISSMTDAELTNTLRMRELQSMKSCQRIWSISKWEQIN